MSLVVEVRTLDYSIEAIEGRFLSPELASAIGIITAVHRCEIREEIGLRRIACLPGNCGNTVSNRLHGEAVFVVVPKERLLKRLAAV